MNINVVLVSTETALINSVKSIVLSCLADSSSSGCTINLEVFPDLDDLEDKLGMIPHIVILKSFDQEKIILQCGTIQRKFRQPFSLVFFKKPALLDYFLQKYIL